jgi:hypothetical protein
VALPQGETLRRFHIDEQDAQDERRRVWSHLVDSVHRC